ncbi:MAG: hypothetical protein ACK4U0_06530 [Mesorhizobium sp.]
MADHLVLEAVNAAPSALPLLQPSGRILDFLASFSRREQDGPGSLPLDPAFGTIVAPWTMSANRRALARFFCKRVDVRNGAGGGSQCHMGLAPSCMGLEQHKKDEHILVSSVHRRIRAKPSV